MKKKIIELIREIAPDFDLNDPDLNIAEDMESIDIIALISELEEVFNISISMRHKTEANFKNVDTLAAMVARLR